MFTLAGIGTGVGSHRYFSHRSFKATRGFQLFLILCQQISGEVKLRSFFGGFSISAHVDWAITESAKSLNNIYHFRLLPFQFSVHYWVRTHRIHHKYTDTDRDTTNINRGFFYSYIGYLFLPRHPDCQREWDRIDMSDIENDKDLFFQFKWVVLDVIPSGFDFLSFKELQHPLVLIHHRNSNLRSRLWLEWIALDCDLDESVQIGD